MTLRIIGLDPGLNHTGWGVVDVTAGRYRLVESGVIHIPQGELSSRLGHITKALSLIIARTTPTLAAAERVFVNVNPQSTLRLGQARGAALVAADLAGLAVEEFTPSEIKEAVTGSGKADKAMIQRMMGLLLAVERPLQADEADALACAVCCANAVKLRTVERSGGTCRPYATARRGRCSSGARAAWTALVNKNGDHS